MIWLCVARLTASLHALAVACGKNHPGASQRCWGPQGACCRRVGGPVQWNEYHCRFAVC